MAKKTKSKRKSKKNTNAYNSKIDIKCKFKKTQKKKIQKLKKLKIHK